MSGWANRIWRLLKLAVSPEARRERATSQRMHQTMDLHHAIDKRIEQYLSRDSYRRGVSNVVLHELARLRKIGVCRPGEYHVRTRTVGNVSIRDERGFVGHNDQGYPVRWLWRRYPEGWRRVDLKRDKPFGPVVDDPAMHTTIVHTSNPDSADNWVRQMFTDPPSHEKETRAMTPYEMFILYAIHAATQSPLPNCASDITYNATASLLKAEMIERSDNRPSGYILAERGRVYLAAVAMLPLPVRTAPPWVMPD